MSRLDPGAPGVVEGELADVGEFAEIEVLDAGLLTTLQDHGRVGWAHLGVPRAGALDVEAASFATRAAGNSGVAGRDDAVLEITMGGFIARNHGPGRWACLAGAPGPLRVGGRAVDVGSVFWWPSLAVLALGRPWSSVRSYLAVSGGFCSPAVLGSRSTDTLAWVGPARIAAGDRLPVGAPAAPPPSAGDVGPVSGPRGALRVLPGPRGDWFGAAAHAALCAESWTVQADSDRIGMRLSGPVLRRLPTYDGVELASEPMVLGAIQVPPSGQPIVFLADHPPTGGYPVIAVLAPQDVSRCAQLRAGQPVRFRSG